MQQLQLNVCVCSTHVILHVPMSTWNLIRKMQVSRIKWIVKINLTVVPMTSSSVLDTTSPTSNLKKPNIWWSKQEELRANLKMSMINLKMNRWNWSNRRKLKWNWSNCSRVIRLRLCNPGISIRSMCDPTRLVIYANKPSP